MSYPDIVPEPVGDGTPFSQLTTMRVGGPAERIRVARSADDLIALVTELSEAAVPWLLVGGGSNTVMADGGFDGTALLVRNTGALVVEDESLPNGTLRLRVQAGHDWDQLVSACVDRDWAGIEALSGIPGLTGAAPVQNIGAYGQELQDVLHSIVFWDAVEGEVMTLSATDLELGYRDSAIKRGREGVVISVDLLLRESNESAPIAYGQLATALGVNVGDRAQIREVRNAVLRLRASKGMVLDANDYDTWSAGSFFTNPIVSEQFARALPADAPKFPLGAQGEDAAEVAVTSLEEIAAGVPIRIPDRVPDRRVKLSAAWLIEHSGITKGFRLPGSGAAISSKHTLAITNRGAASADDVAQLARLVVQRVQQEFGVILVPEPNLYGLEL